jgi:hypothetical protein
MIARATVVEFTPSSGLRSPAPKRLGYDVAAADGGGRFAVRSDDERTARALLWSGVTIEFDPSDQFARLVEPQLAPLPWMTP